MKIVRFSSFQDTENLFTSAITGHEIVFVPEPLSLQNVHLAADAEVVTVFVDCDVSKEIIDQLTHTKLLVTESTGVDHINMAYAQEKGITVVSVPGYGTIAVAEFAFALLLDVSRRITEATMRIREKESFDTKSLRGFDLKGKTLGVLGTGRIGKHAIEIAHGFGMNVIAFDAHQDPTLTPSDTFSYVDIGTLAAKSDIITVHVPYLPETHHLLNAELFAKMKRGVVIINTARGEVIDTMALVEALKSGQVAGAGLDVLESEHSLHNEDTILTKGEHSDDSLRVLGDHMLMHMPNVVVTPHIAFHSVEADIDRVSKVVKAVSDYITVPVVTATA